MNLVTQGLPYKPHARRRATWPPKRSEKAFQQSVVDLAKSLGFMTFHPFDSRHSASGWPDLVLCKPPRLIFAELKAQGQKPTGEQLLWLVGLRDCGVEAYLFTDEGDNRYIAAILMAQP